MKQSFRLSRRGAALGSAALLFLVGAAFEARAQSTSPTPDGVVVQIADTARAVAVAPAPSPSPSPTPTLRNSFAQDVDGDGRFVVIESSGDISTERTDARNNLDGNLEIFLFDYAQRRVFQITNTKNAVKSTTASPQDASNIEVDVLNLRPMLSYDGRYIVFSSNAYSDADLSLTPKDFNGEANETALKADGNTEIFVYRIPDVADADLSSGAEVTPIDLSGGTMTRVTFTPASRLPTAGTATASPFFADDNRAPQPNDDASYVVFISTRNIANVGGASNADANPEVFMWNRTSPSFVQATTTSGLFAFNDNPSISGDGTVIGFYSNADIGTNEPQADQGNGELYAASFNGTAVSNLRRLTTTPRSPVAPTNILSPGRRMSRNGQLFGFESIANFNSNGSLSGALANSYGIYVVRLSDTTFTQVAGRIPSTQTTDVPFRFPTFTRDSSTILFASALNLRATTGESLGETSTEGLNPASSSTARLTQIFAVPVPSGTNAPANYQRLTRLPLSFATIQPLTSDTTRRTAFSIANLELGGGNPDFGSEAFYLIVPPASSESPAATAVSFFTGASERPVLAASPAPTPPAVAGLAPGMLGIARSAVALAPSTREVGKNDAEEARRRPALPVELNGVTFSLAGAGAGLYFVGPNQINFVVPPGLIAASANVVLPVVINNNGAVVRSTVAINPAQPDIFTTTNGAGGRAAVLNVTNACIAAPGEPFAVTTARPTGNVCSSATTETVATELLIMLTGARGGTSSPVIRSEVTVRIGTTDLSGDAIVSVGPSRTHGFDQIVVRLPASLAGAGDVPVVVTITKGGGTFTSRPADTAPRITIQ